MNASLASTPTPTPAQNPSRRRYFAYVIFTLCASLYLLPFMRVLLPGMSEGLLLDRAVSVAHGGIFGRDFFEIVGPGTYYWLALFFKLFGVTFVATRICLFLSSLGTAFLMYFLSRRVCHRYQALPCLLLFATYFGGLWPQISHHTDSNFVALLAFACMVLWQDSRKNSLLFAAGFLAGATTWFLQPKGVLLVCALGVWLWALHWRRSGNLSRLGMLAGGYLSAIAGVLLYFWSRGALKDFVYEIFLWPSRHYSTVGTVPYADGILKYYWNHWVQPMHGFNWTVGLGVVLIIPFLVVAVLPVLLPILGFRHRVATIKPEILLYWVCGWALWLSEFHRKDILHLVFGSPLLLILCVFYLQASRGKVTEYALQILAISAGCLAIFNLFLVLSAHPVATRVGTVAMFKDDPVLTFLDENVAPGTDIFAYPFCPIYYFLSATKNPTRYTAFVYGSTTPAQYQEAIRDLDLHKVRYVVWDTNFETSVADTVFPAAAHMPPQGFLVEPYLESHYTVMKDVHGVLIMERKNAYLTK
ncbi:MAG TPA: glycosyltransferase family 39 protein [Acidobacteriaceae bacterium]|nr:glycosyltransferase family 39 protein [Acidobacteriaceae bacterium]